MTWCAARCTSLAYLACAHLSRLAGCACLSVGTTKQFAGCPVVLVVFVAWCSFVCVVHLQITRQVGLRGRKDFKLFFWFEGHKISPWHDLPLHPFEAPTLHTFVCEIPKGCGLSRARAPSRKARWYNFVCCVTVTVPLPNLKSTRKQLGTRSFRT